MENTNIGADLGRIVYFAVIPILNSESIAFPYSVGFLLNTSPSFLYFTGFLIVLFLWYEILGGSCGSLSLIWPRAELYHNESNRFDFSLQRLTMPLLVLNTCMYVYLCVMYMIDFAVNWPWGSGAHFSIAFHSQFARGGCLFEPSFDCVASSDVYNCNHPVCSVLTAGGTGLHTRIIPSPTKPSYSETAILYLIEVMYLSVFVGFVLYGTPLMLRLSCERISISVIVCGIHSVVSLQ